MRVIAAKTLLDFAAKNPAAAPSLSHWRSVAQAAGWKTPMEVIAVFPKASVLNGERIRFEVAGGNYRLIVSFNFQAQIAFIKFIGSHAEYDRVDALTVSQF